MAHNNFGPILAGRATADYSVTGQYLFVGYSGSVSTVDGVPTVTLASVAGQECMGVLQDKPKSGETASVQTYDVSPVTVGAAIATVGTKVMTDSSGRAVTATSTNRALGETMEVATALGQIISVRLYPVHPIV